MTNTLNVGPLRYAILRVPKLMDAELVKGSTGVYYVDYTTTAAGTLDYRFEGTGAAVAAAESLFGVKSSTVL